MGRATRLCDLPNGKMFAADLIARQMNPRWRCVASTTAQAGERWIRWGLTSLSKRGSAAAIGIFGPCVSRFARASRSSRHLEADLGG